MKALHKSNSLFGDRLHRLLAFNFGGLRQHAARVLTSNGEGSAIKLDAEPAHIAAWR